LFQRNRVYISCRMGYRSTHTYCTFSPSNAASNTAIATLSLPDALPMYAEPVVSNRACELTEGNILSSRSQRDTDTSATRTPAKNVALQNFEKMHEDAEPVVSNRACELSEGKFFSDAFFAFFFAEKKKVPVRHEDKEIVEWEYISRRFATVSAPFS